MDERNGEPRPDFDTVAAIARIISAAPDHFRDRWIGNAWVVGMRDVPGFVVKNGAVAIIIRDGDE
jgi:hypothetical protein